MVLKDIPPNVWSLGLERVSLALDRIGHPERSYPHVLVAGTNGKGSTCVYLEQFVLAAGKSVGVTISPHVNDFTERFRINGQNASEDELGDIYREMVGVLGDIGLTYFEWCVILAVMLFKRHRVDFGIFEIGLGGRYDAANALDPVVCLITEISLDHTDLLGKTVEEIAREKAAIARRGRPLITMAEGAALEEIKREAGKAGAPVIEVHMPVAFRTSMAGPSQPLNAALAREGARFLGLKLNDEQVSQALSKAFLPGRIEEIGGRIILDVAHNPSSLKELIKHLDLRGFHGVGVFGVLRDKDYEPMIAMLRKVCSCLYLAPLQSERSWGYQDMERFIEQGRVIQCASITEAFHKAMATGEQVVVTGSFYAVGEVREIVVCSG